MGMLTFQCSHDYLHQCVTSKGGHCGLDTDSQAIYELGNQLPLFCKIARREPLRGQESSLILFMALVVTLTRSSNGHPMCRSTPRAGSIHSWVTFGFVLQWNNCPPFFRKRLTSHFLLLLWFGLWVPKLSLITKCLYRAISACSLLGCPYGGSPIGNLGGGLSYYPTAWSYLLGSMLLSFLITLLWNFLWPRKMPS